MATSPSDKLVQEQEVGTEEVDPTKTTEEEDEVRTEDEEVRTEGVDPTKTEEVDLAKTTEEDDEVRTEKDETRTEDDEARTQEVDPAKTTEKEDEVKTEEDEVRTEEEDEHKKEAIESLLESARNLNIEDEESNQGTENQNRQEDPITIRRSGQRMERGSTSSSRDQNQNRPLVLPNPPPSAQTSRQMMMMPPRLGPSVPPYQQDPFGLPQPRWLVVDHFYSDGLGLYGALWRFRTITPFLPNQNTYPHQLVPMELPGQPGTELVCYSQSFGVLHQGQLVPHQEAPPMRPQQNQFRSLPPMRPMLPQDDFVVHLGQVPVRPMMYYQEQDQIVPNAGISQPPLRPSLPQLGAPMMQPPVLLYPPPIVNAVPVRPVMNQGGQRFRFPMIQQHQGSPTAPWPEQNQQLQSPRESQGSNDGPFSSGGSQD
ncbi:PREDICTED: protein transport protein SEC31-like isoform X2 [Brassica oleracea var. oleracea]|uniref:protein transport protein SEC31-like isoform X2 n=1 Tax=Brassica oleracea var. oleracea TaxID=109376 RepID=UPI0006A6ED01|nr:PREDICTED: protein transport protein SEC31-like isoform X2 [Brassica oleracea var. oleracea]